MRRSDFVGSVLGLVAAVLPLVVLAGRAQGQCPVTPRCVPWNVQQAGATCSARVGTNYNPLHPDPCFPSSVSDSDELEAEVRIGSPGVFFGVAYSSSDAALVWNADAHLSHPATAGSPVPYHAGAATSWSDSLRIVGGQGGGMATFWFELSGSTSAVASCAFGQVRIDGVDPFGGNAPTALTSFSVSKAFTFGSAVPLLVELLAYVESESDVLASAQSTFQLRLTSVSIAPPIGRFWIASTRCGIYPGATALPGARIYVDANALGANDGSSWTDAFPRLQDALALAAVTNPLCFSSSRVEVWTAPGVYRPDVGMAETIGNTDASFFLRSGVDLIGGLPVGASSLTQQDVVANVSLLTGELSTPVVRALHVVRAAGVTGASTSIDGFTIEKGSAQGVSSTDAGRGGGLLAVGGDHPVVVRNCTFRENDARWDGGALHADLFHAALDVERCRFVDNLVTTSGGTGGGAAALSGAVSASFRDCTFTNNSAPNSGGGAIANYGEKALLIEDCEFRSNSAPLGYGGAVAHFASTPGAGSQPTFLTIRRSTFSDNDAARGGAVAAQRSDLSESSWTDNTASFDGGAVHLSAASGWSSTITACALSRNKTESDGGRGGGIYCTTLLTMDRCELSANQARDSGGGVFHSGNQIEMKQCALVKNTALQIGGGGGGGGLRTQATSAVLTNCTIADNVGGHPYRHDVYCNAVTARNTIVDSALDYGASFSGGPLTQVNCIIELAAQGSMDPDDPGFRDREHDDYRLASSSIGIDQGDAAFLPSAAFDLAGGPRRVEEPLVADAPGVPFPAIDLGALESQGYQRGIVYCTAGTTTNGCSPAISASGEASASSTGSFVISASQVETNKQGLFFYGIGGASAAPWGTGGSSYLCVKAPTQRTGVQNSGGTGPCDGAFVLDWNAYRAAHPTALGMAFSSGDTCWLQGWFRDPPAVKSTNLTNALEFAHVP
jgi:predicted outer membrane repeat protein